MSTSPKRVSRGHIATLRGMSRMAVDATTGLADLVQALHTRIARTPTRLGGPLVAGAVNGITDLVYDSVRGVTRAVGGGLDAALAQLGPLMAALSDDAKAGAKTNATADEAAPPARTREALVAALNGVLGDYLAETQNPLAIGMALRRGGVPLALTREALAAAIPAPSGKLLVLVHGLCMNDLQWERGGAIGPTHDHGAALARDLGYTAVYLHYNSGRHISTNGHELAVQLESLAAAWPVAIEAIAIVGHSMGGLLARSAVHYATAEQLAWPRRLRALVFLGTPHHGAPLERGGHWIDVLLAATPYTAPFARLGRVRSAGITDLRHGSVRDEDWRARSRFAHGARVNEDTRHPLPLPQGVACCTIAASLAAAKGARANDAAGAAEAAAEAVAADDLPVDTLPGDGLVPVASALGRHADPSFVLAFAPSNQWIVWDSGHLDLLSSQAVYARTRDALAR